MKTGTLFLLAILLTASCSKRNMNDDETLASNTSEAGMLTGFTNVANSNVQALNSRQGTIHAWCDENLFAISFKKYSDQEARNLLDANKSINVIYLSEDLITKGAMHLAFTPVLDGIKGEGANPIWLEEHINFNSDFTPHQFLSDAEIDAAASGPNPEITLSPTGNVYRCSLNSLKN